MRRLKEGASYLSKEKGKTENHTNRNTHDPTYRFLICDCARYYYYKFRIQPSSQQCYMTYTVDILWQLNSAFCYSNSSSSKYSEMDGMD